MPSCKSRGVLWKNAYTRSEQLTVEGMARTALRKALSAFCRFAATYAETAE